jgi:hypothetical protein
MVVHASPPGTTSRRTAGTTGGRSSRSGPGTGTASRTARSGRRVASATAGEGRRVADRAAGETSRLAGRAKDQGGEVARTARRQSSAVARTAGDSAREVGTTVRAQAAEVRDELAAHGRGVVVEQQSQAQARRAGERLSRLASEAHALAEGRPDEAETLRTYVTQGADRLMDAADRLYGLADEIDERGIEGVASDLQRFARRRPGVFLLGAAVAGFGVGRVVRSAQDDDGAGEAWDDEEDAGDDEAPAYTGTRRRAVAAGQRALAGAPRRPVQRSAR